MVRTVKSAPKVLLLLVLIVVGGLFVGHGSDARAEQQFESRLIESIPGKYALIEVIGDFSDTTEEQFEALFPPLYERFSGGAIQTQVFYFQSGSKYRDGFPLFLVGTMTSGSTLETINFALDPEKYADTLGLGRPYFWDLAGYTGKIERLTREYSENELVAYETYNNREILIEGDITDIKVGLSGPQIVLDGDEFGLGGLKVTLNTNDAHIRKVKKGSRVVVRLRIQNYLMGQLQAEGRIIFHKDNSD